MSAGLTSQRRKRLLASVTVTVAVCAIVTACGSSTQESGGPTPNSSASPSRQAGVFRASKVCVINNSPVPISVSFTKKDGTSGEGNLAAQAGPDRPACGYGKFYFSRDLEGTISTSHPDSSLFFYASNPANNKPFFAGMPVGDKNAGYCLGPFYSSVFDSDDWDNGILHFHAIRDEDTAEYIEWNIRISASDKPTKDGSARLQCKS